MFAIFRLRGVATCCAMWCATGCANPFASKSGIGNQPGADKDYQQLSREYRDRSVAAPALGTGETSEPSTMKKFGAALVGAPKAVGQSVSKGAGKVKDWATPNETPKAAPAYDATSLASKTKMSPDMYIATARVYENAGNSKAAAEQYEKALKLSPNDLPTLLSYAHLLDRQGKFEEAIRRYEQAVKAHPNEAAAHNDLGLCYGRCNLSSQAVAALTKAVELQPERALYRNNLAMQLVEQNRPDEALAQFKAVHGEAIAHNNVACLLQQKGQTELAASHFRRAAQLDPNLMGANVAVAQRGTPAPAGTANTGSVRVFPSPAAATPTGVAPAAGPLSSPNFAARPQPGAYGVAPEPGPEPQYLTATRPAPTDAYLVGNRYATPVSANAPIAPQPVANNVPAVAAKPVEAAIPPSPDDLRNYQPALNAELNFLPPVE